MLVYSQEQTAAKSSRSTSPYKSQINSLAQGDHHETNSLVKTTYQ